LQRAMPGGRGEKSGRLRDRQVRR